MIDTLNGFLSNTAEENSLAMAAVLLVIAMVIVAVAHLRRQ